MVRAWLPRKNQIALVEIFAVVIAVIQLGPTLVGKNVTIMVDSECALDALIKGFSKFEDVIHLISVFWEAVAHYQICVYLDRVSTDSNISDDVSREKFEEAVRMGWHFDEPDVEAIFPSKGGGWASLHRTPRSRR